MASANKAYTNERPLRVFEAFAGYGSQAMALERLSRDYPDFHFKVVGISEIDKYAIQAYMAVHGETPNYGDITKIEASDLPDFDLLTYSFPCTDISVAGQQKGLAEGSGTRSGLLWECRRIIQEKRPKFLLMENVKALLSDKFRKEYVKWLNVLDAIGYRTFTQILNASSYGVPQNRERVFSVSIQNTGDTPFYRFPKGEMLTRCVADLLESNVDKSYFTPPEKLKQIRWIR